MFSNFYIKYLVHVIHFFFYSFFSTVLFNLKRLNCTVIQIEKSVNAFDLIFQSLGHQSDFGFQM